MALSVKTTTLHILGQGEVIHAGCSEVRALLFTAFIAKQSNPFLFWLRRLLYAH